MTTFSTSPRHFITSESVTEGHPDKICDQVSDSILDAILAQDPHARVACETSVTTGLVLVCGEITTTAVVDVPTVVRETLRRIGYTDPTAGFDADGCAVVVALGKQSPDIAQGVGQALEVRSGVDSDDDAVARVGAGDQGMMVGFACDETPELMPLSVSLAHGLTRRLAQVRRSGELAYLRPDGKSQVTVEYAYGRPRRVEAIVVSTQHRPEVGSEQIYDDVLEHVIRPVVPAELMDDRTRIYVNPTGRFVIGGPVGDAGLTGRKIIVDTYGGVVRHGGGAFSGKDPTKVDRSASYAARWVAKNVVAAGLARRCEVQLCYAIGMARPLAVSLETFDTAAVPDDRILEAVQAVFDLRPGAIIRDLDLRRPIFAATAAYGHFGRTDIDAPWERTDRVQALLERVEADRTSASRAG
ncbi:MAG TPA: methionine adenosyltransferase [Candidatus Dormibacteraeota bacterium]|nr:methionine adenosyltransferase [Candidatus Dormibacteraeota bacterium]